MKKINTIMAMVIALIFITGVYSCNKKMELFVAIDEQTVCLPDYSTQLPKGHYYSFEYPLSKVKSEFDKQGITYDVNRINDIKVSAFTLKYKSGGLASNLKELLGAQVYIKKAGSTDSIQVADVAIPDTDVKEVNFNVSGQSLKPYLNEDKIVFSVTVFQRNGTGSKAVCFDLTSGKISVEAKK